MMTQAELRQFATFMTQNESATDFERELAAEYLRLTDPTPLTAEHCRAAGMSKCDSGTNWERVNTPHSVSALLVNNTSVILSDDNPTVGLLYAAQRWEESRNGDA